MTTADNRRHPLPGLDKAAISRLAARWNDQGLWDDIQILVNALWSSEGDAERRLRWHHLVVAVGNFKRDGGRRLHPAHLADSARTEAPTAQFAVPGTSVLLGCEERASWSALEDCLPGAGPATTTTLLAAIWPSRHLVFDRRVHAMTNALRMLANLSTSVAIEPASTRQIPATMSSYTDVRDWLLSTSEVTGQPLVSVERALYVLIERQLPAGTPQPAPGLRTCSPSRSSSGVPSVAACEMGWGGSDVS